jgi:hypothetical protein
MDAPLHESVERHGLAMGLLEDGHKARGIAAAQRLTQLDVQILHKKST